MSECKHENTRETLVSIICEDCGLEQWICQWCNDYFDDLELNEDGYCEQCLRAIKSRGENI